MAGRLNRRDWIGGCLAGAAGLSWTIAGADDLASGDRAADEPFEIIDCHTHFYDPKRPGGIPWPPANSPLYRTVLPQHLLEQPMHRRVTGTVVVEASSRIEDNAWLLDLAEQNPVIVGIVGRLEPGLPEFAQQVEHYSALPLFRGIRVASTRIQELLEGNSLDDFRRLADHNLSLDVNGGPDSPAVTARLAERLPDLRIVQNHIGNVAITEAPPPEGWQAGIRAASEHPNVFCKISALVEGAARNGKTAPDDLAFYRPYIDVVWEAFGADRVIYGSNWPVSERAADYRMVQRIAMEYASEQGPDALRKFCSENAQSAYQWINRGGRG